MNWGLVDLDPSPLPLTNYVTLGATTNLSVYVSPFISEGVDC